MADLQKEVMIVYESGKYFATHNGNMTQEYRLWKNMLRRACSQEYHKIQPTYKDCTVSDNFKNFQFFAEWCNNQIGFGNKGWSLDKDILSSEGKTYSEDTCCFVPREINNLLCDRAAKRGDYPIGVSYFTRDATYRACIRKFGKTEFIGYYPDVMSAHEAYKKVKELYVKQVAEKFKDQISPRVYEALFSWKVQL